MMMERSLSYNAIFWYYVIAITTCTTVEANIFNTVPITLRLWVGKTATFECGTNNATYTLSFIIPGDIPLVASTVEHLPGGGTLATIGFTVTSDNNGTSVRCIADADGSSLQITAPAFAYGYDEVPHNITSLKVMIERANCSLSISWSQWDLPFLSPELIVVYNVRINGTTNDVFNTTDTSVTYVPTIYGSHDVTTVTVIPIAGPLIGEGTTVDTSNVIPEFKNDETPFEANINSIRRTNTSIDHSYWTYPLNLTNAHICPFVSSNTVVTCRRPEASYDSTSITVHQKGGDVEIESVLKLPDKHKFLTCAHISYRNGNTTYSTVNLNTSTFDLQTVQPIFTSNGKICLKFTRVNGSLTSHVHMVLRFKSSKPIIKNYEFPGEQLVGTTCYNDIRETILTLEAYDGLDSTDNPAVVLNNIEVPKPLDGSLSAVVPTTSKTKSIEPSASNIIATAKNHDVFIITSAVLGITGIILIVIITCICIIWMIKCKKKFKMNVQQPPNQVMKARQWQCNYIRRKPIYV